ncbi:MAG: YbdD/YjiX family protein [Gemmatimonadota bacterium]
MVGSERFSVPAPPACAVIGAPDYDRYLEHHAWCHPDRAPPDRRAYYSTLGGPRFGDGASRCC